MEKLLKGKIVADKINEEILSRLPALYEKGIVPTLAIVRVGENPGDIAYENGAVKKRHTASAASSGPYRRRKGQKFTGLGKRSGLHFRPGAGKPFRGRGRLCSVYCGELSGNIEVLRYRRGRKESRGHRQEYGDRKAGGADALER